MIFLGLLYLGGCLMLVVVALKIADVLMPRR